MNVMLRKPMSVDEFLRWTEGEAGRYELVNGTAISMSPERAQHAEVKFAVCVALKNAIRAAKLDCHALPDGMTVRIDSRTAFEPDALVYRGPKIDPASVEVREPLIVCEVLSPGTGSYDLGAKLAGYFLVPSLEHYLIVDPERRTLIHHRRDGDGSIATLVVRAGNVQIEPPGLSIELDALFGVD